MSLSVGSYLLLNTFYALWIYVQSVLTAVEKSRTRQYEIMILDPTSANGQARRYIIRKSSILGPKSGFFLLPFPLFAPRSSLRLAVFPPLWLHNPICCVPDGYAECRSLAVFSYQGPHSTCSAY